MKIKIFDFFQLMNSTYVTRLFHISDQFGVFSDRCDLFPDVDNILSVQVSSLEHSGSLDDVTRISVLSVFFKRQPFMARIKK